MKRRDFLKQSAAGAAITVLGRATPSLIASDSTAKVAIVRSEDRVKGIESAIDMIQFPSPAGKRVLLKPNFNTADPTPDFTLKPDNQIKRVIFFAGDVHASMSVELISPSNLKIISVISSPFFWPYPHPSARRFKSTGTVDGGIIGKFRLANASRVINDDNFARVSVDLNKIEIDVFERKGGRKLHKEHRFES